MKRVTLFFTLISCLTNSDAGLSAGRNAWKTLDARNYSGDTAQENGQQRPNIIVFMSDDLGHADLSYVEGSLQTPTPNIDKLAWDGIILNRHYTLPTCTPTRSSFMTGKYVFQIGMQSGVIRDGEPWGLPVDLKIQPQYFKDLGYSTHMVGKWHLGSHERAYYPGARGFDYWYASMGGELSWFNYTTAWITPIIYIGINLRDNGKAVFPNVTQNVYFPDLITAKAEQIIKNSSSSTPFYLYFATPVPHAALHGYSPAIQTMPEFQLRQPVYSFTNQYPERKQYLATIQQLDDSFKRIVTALTEKQIIHNTIIVFFSDNGGQLPVLAPYTHGSNHASNWPLRLGKNSVFEGGVRTPAFIWSPLLKRRGRITNQLFHVVDWLPTLLEAAGGKAETWGNISGISQWETLQSGSNVGPRTELVINIDARGNQSAMIYEDEYGVLYKIIRGNVVNENFTGWYRSEGTSVDNEMTIWTPASVDCNFPEGVEISPCRSWLEDCLFDLTNDPCEQNNIARSYPAMLDLLRSKLVEYNATSVPIQNKPFDPMSNPDLYGGIFVPWKDPNEILDKVPLVYQDFNPVDSV